MKVVLLAVTLLGALPVRAQGDLFQLSGDIDVRWASPQEVVQGLGRKFYPGETLHLTVTGQWVQNNERIESHCAIFDWFCKDVRVPAPQTLVPATYAPVFTLVAETDNAPLFPNQILIPAAGLDFAIPEDVPERFGRVWRLKAMIPEGTNFNRAICVGAYTLHIAVDNTRRLTAFRNYLAAAARTSDTLRDVLDERLTTHYGPQVADDLSTHAQARFANNANPALKREYPLVLQRALEINPGSPSIQRRLAEYYVAAGDFPSAQAAALAAAKNANDEADRGQAYILLGQVKEGQGTQLATGSVRAAVALYDQAVDLGASSQHRTLLLDALNRDAHALRRLHTRTALGRAAELFERARDAAPAAAVGLVADLNAGDKLLTTRVRFGFTLVSNVALASGDVIGGAEDDWLPVATEPGGRVLVSRSSGSVEWLNPQQTGTQPLGTAVVSEAAAGNGSALVMATNGELILMTPSRPQKKVMKSAPRVFSPGNPPDLNAPFVSFFGMAANAEVVYWCSPATRVHLQNYQGVDLRTIDIAANELFLAGAVSPNGRLFAAVVVTSNPPGQAVLRIWNVTDSGQFNVAKNAQGAVVTATFWAVRKGGISFSPDGRRIYWNVDRQLHAIKSPEFVLESSLDVGSVVIPVTPLGGGQPFAQPISHTWVDADHLAVYASLEQQVSLPDKPIVLVKHSTLAALAASARPSYGFSGQPDAPAISSGPLFLGGNKDGEVLAVRAVQKHQARVYSLADGSEHGKVEFQPTDLSNGLAVVDDGHTIVNLAMSGTALYGLNSSDVTRQELFLYGPLQELDHGNWQALEAEKNTLRPLSLHRFHGRTEIAAANLPPIDPAMDLLGAGKLCAPPAGPFAWPPAGWLLFPFVRSAQGARLVPNAFVQLPPAAYPHNMMDVSMISMRSDFPPATEIRRLMSCARLVALANGSKAALQVVEPGFGSPLRLVFSPGEGAANPIDVLPAIAPASGGPFPIAPSVDGRFLPDGKSFGVVVLRAGQAPQVSFWKYDGSGLAQQPCSTCSRPNLSSMENVQAANPGFLAPVFLFSVSGRKVLLVAGDRMLVHDFAGNTVQFQMGLERPVILTDEALITLGKDNEIHIWRF